MNNPPRGFALLVALVLAHAALAQSPDVSTAGAKPAPPLDEPLVPRPGMMIGRVMTWDGRPVPRFTIEYAAYAVESYGVHVDPNAEPNVVAKVEGRDGYYEIRLPEGSYGLVSGVTLPLLEGHQTFRFWAETPGATKLDFLEVKKGNPGVIKNFVWNLRTGSAASFVASPNYGASLTIADAPEHVKNVATKTLGSEFPPTARIAIKLTPRSALIDGTEGRVLNRVLLLGETAGRGFTLHDIPFAVYDVSATLRMSDGTDKELRVASGPAETSVDGMNRTFRWKGVVQFDFVTIGTAASEAERNSARLVIGSAE